MEVQEFNSLINKFKAEKCSLSELQQLKDQLQHEDQVKNWMLEALEHSGAVQTHPINYNQLFKKIKHEISEKEKKKRLRTNSIALYSLKRAAILLFVFLAGGFASYFLLGRTGFDTNSYSEIVAPLGSKTQITLPDGSQVSLNAGTRLQYPNTFNKNNRNVILEGEAFFQVEKNKQLPFIVNAMGLAIKVVGTTFNVKAYQQENTITTLLVEGKVTLESDQYKLGEKVELHPSEKAILSKKNRQLIVRQVKDIYSEIAWKDNLLVIKGENLAQLAVKLERKYNVTIHFHSDDVKSYKFSGTLKDETIQQVLDIIKLSAPINYKIDGKDIILTTNKQTRNSYDKLLK